MNLKKIIARIAHKPLFWRIKQLKKKINFHILRHSFKYRYKLKKRADDSVRLLQLGRWIITPVFLSLVTGIILIWFDEYIMKFPLGIPFLEEAIGSIPTNTYSTLMATVAGVGGVFIALYYTILSSLISSTYADASNNIRKILEEESYGNIYMNLIAFLTFLSVFFLGTRAIGFSRSYSGAGVILILSAFGVFGFVRLGKMYFNFLDPTRLWTPIFNDFEYWLEQVQVKKGNWDEPVIQEHARKQSKKKINALRNLWEYAKDTKNLREKPLVKLLKKIIVLLYEYQSEIKPKIPPNSLWYEKKYEQQDWYSTDYFSLEVAQETGTSLQPKESKEKFWVEKELFPLVLKTLDLNLVRQNFDHVLDILNHTRMYFKAMVQRGEVDQAFERFGSLRNRFIDYLDQTDKERIDKENRKKLVAILDLLSRIIIDSFYLTFIEKGENLENGELREKLKETNWSKDEEIFDLGLDPALLPKVQTLQEKLKYELDLEKSKVTPDWYIVDTINRFLIEKFLENAKSVISGSISEFDKLKDRLKDNHPWLLASVLSREREFVKKWKNTNEQISRAWKKPKEKRIDPNTEWSSFDLEKYNSQFEELRCNNLKLSGKVIDPLLRDPKSNNLPDYPGEFLDTLGNELFLNLTNCNQQFLDLFPFYMNGSLLKYNLLMSNSRPDTKNRHQVVNDADPLLDLMELSGLSLLFSEFHKDCKIWKFVREMWDGVLYDGEKKGNPEEVNLATVLRSILALRKINLANTQREMLRTRWRQEAKEFIQSKITMKSVSRGEIGAGPLQPQHDKPLVNIFAKEYSTVEGIDIFSDFYLHYFPVNFEGSSGREKDQKINKTNLRERVISEN